MIVAERPGVVFIKTRKTAGTSIELWLRGLCDQPGDVITPVTPEDEELARSLGLPGPRNHGPSHRVPARQLGLRRVARAVRHRDWPRRNRFSNHTPAARAARLLPQWDDHLTFAVVRNPWEAAVSWYYWDRSYSGSEATMDEVFSRPGLWSRNWATIAIDDRVGVDRVCRFERLGEDLTATLAEVGVPFDGDLPRAKVSTGRPDAPLRELLAPRHIDAIARACRREIEEFGYEI